MRQAETTPGIAQSLVQLQRLIDVWHNGAPDVYPALGDTALRGVNLYAHVDHTVRLARAVLALAHQELYLEEIPLIRMMLECAVTVGWLAVTPDSGDAALQEATRLRRAFVNDIATAAARSFDSELADLDAAMEELAEFRSEEAHRFDARCKALAGGMWLYVAYRDLSTYSHAGALLLDYYIQHDDVPGGFVYVGDQDVERAASDIARAVWFLHIALSAYDSLVPDDDRTVTLAEIATESGFLSDASRVEIE